MIAELLLFSGCQQAPAVRGCRSPVFLNEVFASSHAAELGGATVDWVELYNAGDEPVDLRGWSLSRLESLEHPVDFMFDEGSLDPEAYLVLVADVNEVEGYTDIGFDLNRDVGALYLRGNAKEDYGLCDEVRYPDQHADFSWQRMVEGVGEDAGNDWCQGVATTPGESNEGTACMCEGSPWC